MTSAVRAAIAPLDQWQRAVLVRMDSVHAGQVHTLNAPEWRLGRHPSCELVVDDDGTSRVHARVFCANGKYFIEDMQSRNGTYVNGVRTDRVELHDGAMIQIGIRACLRFSRLDENQERMLKQLHESSVRDGLTGAYNRPYFRDRLQGELAYASRHKAPSSLLLVDIDFFKRVNDTYGHLAGDTILRAVSESIARTLRREDVFARLGGEEFAVLLRGAKLESCVTVAERLRLAVEALEVRHGGELIKVTVSIGCASTRCCDPLTDEALLAAADRRLYRAKAEGRNRVVFADS